MRAGTAVNVATQERMLCHGCEERFAVDGYTECPNCLAMDEQLDARWLQHHRILDSQERDKAGLLDYEFFEQQNNPVENWKVYLAIGGGMVGFVLLVLGGWHFGRLLIGMALEISH